MKTKNLMTAFALSAMFAACTQDAELNETIAKNDFSNIPMVEADFTADFGVESRMATKFGLEVGDKVGLAWLGDVDNIYTNNTTGMAYQNHPLFCTDATKKAFKTETMLYVGKYFAYMPYTQGEMAIENIAFSIAEQPLTANANELAKQAIYLSTETTLLEKANNKGEVATDGAQKAGMGNNVKLNLALLNNPTTIKFAFKNIDALTGLKITGIKVDMVNGTYSAGSALIKNFKHNGKAIEDWTEMTGEDFVAINSTYEKGAVELKGELAVTNNAVTTYALLLPSATELAGTTLNIALTTNYGTVVAENVKVDNAKLFTNFGETATVTADVDGKKIKNTAATAKTQAELNEILTKLAASAQEEAVEITLNPETAASPKAAFTLTDFTLPETLKANVTLTTGDKTNGTIEFAGTTVINKPVIVLSTPVVTGNMTIEYIKNAPYTFNCVELTVDHDAVLINNGLFSGSIITVAADEEEGLGFGKYVSNNKEAKLINNCEIENNGEVQWIAGEKPVIVAGTNSVYAEATDLAGIKAANAAQIEYIRLLDGASIYNQTEDYTFNWVGLIECYGNVNFYVTDTPSGISKSISFYSESTINVMEGANLTINSDNKNNSLTIKYMNVGKDATLSASNIILPAHIVNKGAVVLTNVIGFQKEAQGEGSTWNEINNN